MAKVDVYARLKESPSSGYLYVEDMILQCDIEVNYNRFLEDRGKYGITGKCETLEGYKLQHVLIAVEYDGRKNSINKNDILKALCKQKLAEKVGECMIAGDYCLPTDELKTILDNQLNQRKELINNGHFIITEHQTA